MKVAKIAGLALALLVALVAAAAILLHTPWARSWVLGQTQGLLREAVGLEVSAHRLDYNLLTGSVWVEGLVLRSAGSENPLLEADRLAVRVYLPALLGGGIEIEEARIERPRIAIRIAEDGSTNLPETGVAEPTSAPSAAPPIRIRKLSVENAEVHFEDLREQLAASLPGLSLEVEGAGLAFEHLVRLEATRPGWIRLAGRELPLSELRLRGSAGSDGAVEIEAARIAFGSSYLEASGPIDPGGWTLTASGRLDAGELARWGAPEMPVEGILEPDVTLEGLPGRFKARIRATGRNVSWADFRATALTLAADWDEADQRLEAGELTLRSPLGNLAGKASLALDGEGASSLEARLEALRLEELLRAAGQQPVLASSATALVNAAWDGWQVEAARGKADIRLSPAEAPGAVSLGGSIQVTSDGRVLRVAAPDVTASGARIGIEASTPASLDGDLTGGYRIEIADLEELRVGLQPLLGEDTALPELAGRLSVSGDLAGALTSPRATLLIDGSAQTGQFDEVRLTASGSASLEAVMIDQGQVDWNGQSLMLRGGARFAPEGPLLEAQAETAAVALGPLLATLGQDLPVDGTLAFDLSVEGPLDGLSGGARLQIADLRAYGQTFGTLRSGARVEGTRLEIGELRLDQPDSGGVLETTGYLDWQSREYQVQARLAGLRLDTFEAPGAGPVDTTLALELSGQGTLEQPAIEARLEAQELVVQGRLLGTLTLDARLQDGELTHRLEAPRFALASEGSVTLAAPYPARLEITARDTDLAHLDLDLGEGQKLAGSIRGSIEVTGELERLEEAAVQASIESLAADIRGIQVANDGVLRAAYENHTLAVESLALRAGPSWVRLDGALPARASRPPGSLSVAAEIDLAQVFAALPESPGFTAEGLLKLDGKLEGSLEEPVPTLAARLEDGMFDQEGLFVAVTSIALDTVYEAGLITLRDFRASFGPAELAAQGQIPLGLLIDDLPFPAPAPTGPARFNLDVKGLEFRAFSALPEDMDGGTDVQLAAEAASFDDWNQVQGRVSFPGLRLRYRQYNLQPAEPIVLALAEGNLRLDSFSLEGPGTKLQATGTVGVTGDYPLALRVNGDLNAGILSFFTTGLDASGPTRIELAAAGTAKEPLLEGFLHLRNGELGIASPRVRAEDLELRLGFAGDRVSIETLTGSLNGGELRGEGSLRVPGGEIQDVNLKVGIERVFLELAGLRTASSGEITLRSQDANLVLGGQVQILEGIYEERIDLATGLLGLLNARTGPELAAERSPFLERLRFGLGVRTAQPLVVRNNLAELESTLNVTLVGTYYRPALTGRIDLEENGKIFLRERTFVVERGSLAFLSEARIEAIMDIVASTQTAGYDITLNVSGTSSKPETSLISDPPLPEPDILAVLLTGRTLDNLEGQEVNVARDQTLSFLSGTVGGRLTSGVEGALGLSKVRIEPNLISGESNPGARLTIGEQITRDLELIYSMNLRDSSDQIWAADYRATRRFDTRVTKQSDNSYRFDLRHDIRFGSRAAEEGVARGTLLRKRIGEITFSGNLIFPEDRLRGRLGAKPGRPYDFFRIRKGLDRLEAYYYDRDYLEARVRLHREESEDVVNLRVDIEPGPELEFVYEGYNPPGSVKSAIRQIWQRGLFDQQRTADALTAIQEQLARERYYRVRLSHQIQTPTAPAFQDPDSPPAEEPASRKRVLFEIDPGPRFPRAEIVFEGAAGIPPAELTQQLEAAELETAVMTDPRPALQFLRRYYESRGYLAAQVGPVRRDLDDPSAPARFAIQIEEGPAFRVGALRFEGNRAIAEQDLRTASRLVPGFPYRPDLRERTREAIEELYWRKGYNEVVVDFELTGSAEAGQVDIAFLITENQQSVIQGISVAGNERTSEQFIRRQITIEPGTPLDLDETARVRKSLYDTGAYALVEVEREEAVPGIGIPGPQGTVRPMQLNVRVRERQPFEIRYGAFYDTDRGPGAIIDLMNRNSLGSARVVGGRARYDRDVRELRGFFSQPFLRELPIRSNLTLFRRHEVRQENLATPGFPVLTEEPFIIDRGGVEAQQAAQLANRFLLTYGYRWERIRVFSTAEGVDDFGIPIDIFDITQTNAPLTATLTRDTRDDILDAARGSFLSSAFDLSLSSLGSNLRFWKYFGQYFKYVPLGAPRPVPFAESVLRPRLVYAGGVRVGLARGLVDQSGERQEVVPSERFFAGGGTTVRGFEQNLLGPVFDNRALGGEAVFVANNEIRAPLFSFFDGVAFLDVGNVYRRFGDFDLTDLRKTAGAGIRVRTPYFVLRLDYGFKLDRRVDESRGAFFFSIGQAF